MNACPDCGGPRLPNHPAGALTYTHAEECGLGRAQAATQHADYERTASVRSLTRPATDAEQTLLGLGLGLVPSVEVDVERVTEGGAVVRRVYREGVA